MDDSNIIFSIGKIDKHNSIVDKSQYDLNIGTYESHYHEKWSVKEERIFTCLLCNLCLQNIQEHQSEQSQFHCMYMLLDTVARFYKQWCLEDAPRQLQYEPKQQGEDTGINKWIDTRFQTEIYQYWTSSFYFYPKPTRENQTS